MRIGTLLFFFFFATTLLLGCAKKPAPSRDGAVPTFEALDAAPPQTATVTLMAAGEEPRRALRYHYQGAQTVRLVSSLSVGPADAASGGRKVSPSAVAQQYRLTTKWTPIEEGFSYRVTAAEVGIPGEKDPQEAAIVTRLGQMMTGIAGRAVVSARGIEAIQRSAGAIVKMTPSSSRSSSWRARSYSQRSQWERARNGRYPRWLEGSMQIERVWTVLLLTLDADRGQVRVELTEAAGPSTGRGTGGATFDLRRPLAPSARLDLERIHTMTLPDPEDAGAQVVSTRFAVELELSEAE